MSRLPHTISNQSLTFFVKGKPYSITKDHEHFLAAKDLLQQPGAHPVQRLIEMVDARQALLRDSHGALQIIGADLVYRGQVLHGLWVDKIKQFRAASEPFTPLFNALGSLVLNPTPEAIERLPVFLEKSGLGFLEDGRFIAYKAVKEDYFDIHTGKTFRNMIGDTPFMPRTQVNADPNACCSTGLHVGTPGYVSDFSLGTTGRRVMLIAVWPHDVVSVPHSYNGTKMRICAYEVIDELDDVYAGTILGRPVLTPRSRLPEVPAAEEQADANIALTPYESVKVGDVISYRDYDVAFVGLVVGIDEEDTIRVRVTGTDGSDCWVSDTDFVEIIPRERVTAAMLAYEGCTVTITDHPRLRDGRYVIAGLEENGDGAQDVPTDVVFEIELNDDEQTRVPVQNQHITVVSDEDGKQLFPLPESVVAQDVEDDVEQLEPAVETEPYQPQPGDLVEATGPGWPPAGIYPVIVSNDIGVMVQTEHDGTQVITRARYGAVTPRPWMRAEIGGRVYITGHDIAPAAWLEVIDMGLTWDTPQIQVRTSYGPWWVDVHFVTAVEPKA